MTHNLSQACRPVTRFTYAQNFAYAEDLGRRGAKLPPPAPRPQIRHANRSPEARQEMAAAAAIMLRAGGTPELVRALGMPSSDELAEAMERLS